MNLCQALACAPAGRAVVRSDPTRADPDRRMLPQRTAATPRARLAVLDGSAGVVAGLYGNPPATVFQKPMPLIRSYLMVTDLVLLNRMVIRSYQLRLAFCRTTWLAVIVTGSDW
jgi:hypothetical protein